MQKGPFWKKRQKCVSSPREKSTCARSVPKRFADYFFQNDNDHNCDNGVVFASGSKSVVTMDKEGDLSRQGKHLYALILIQILLAVSRSVTSLGQWIMILRES